MTSVLAALTPSYAGLFGSLVFDVVVVVLVVVEVAGMWMVFEKAGEPGWGSLIPLYNLYLLCRIAGRPGWWWLLAFVPVAGGLIWFILNLIVSLDIARQFDKGSGFGVGLWLLGFIFYPMLGFSDAHYGRRSDGPLVAAYAAQAQYAQSVAAPATGGAWVARRRRRRGSLRRPRPPHQPTPDHPRSITRRRGGARAAASWGGNERQRPATEGADRYGPKER
jgi:hypothetical protein